MPSDLTNAVAIAAGQGFIVALRSDGRVAHWGSGQDDLHRVDSQLTNITAISVGYGHALALRSDGRIFGWGPFGHVQREAILTPPEWLTNAVAIDAGYDHNLALTSDGFVIAWGANGLGVLNVPLAIRNVRGLAAGQQFSLAILPDQSLFGWGIDYQGELVFPVALTNVVQVDASVFEHCLGLRADGGVFAWGNNSHGQAQVPLSLTGAVQVAAGPLHSLALRPDGTVAAWGANGADYAKPPPVSLRFFALAAGSEFSVGLTRGPVVTSGSQWVEVVAGQDRTLAMGVASSTAFQAQWRRDGVALAGATNLDLQLINVQSADAATYTLTVSNEFGGMESPAISLVVHTAPPRITLQPTHVAVLPGEPAEFRVSARGSEPLWYQWQFNGVDIPGATNATLQWPSVGFADEGSYGVAVANGYESVTSQVARLSVGRPVFLAQPSGRLLLPGMDTELICETLSPEPLHFQWFRDGEPVAGANESALRLTHPEPWQAGAYSLVVSNTFGAITSRVARLRFRTIPVPTSPPGVAVAWGQSFGDLAGTPEDLTNVIAVSVGLYHGLGLRADGRAAAWGYGSAYDGELDVPPGLTNVVAIQAGAFHNLALRDNGTVVGWGSRSNLNVGQWSVPAELTNVVEVAAGRAHSLALVGDGTVVRWPWPEDLPAGLSNVVALAVENDANLALRADGTVFYWAEGNPQNALILPPDPVGIETISVGPAYGLLRRLDGSWIPAGTPALPGPVPSSLSNAVAMDVAQVHALALNDDGTLAAWGIDVGGNLTVPATLRGVTAISANYYNNLAISVAPFITHPPQDQIVLAGHALLLEVSVRSSTPVTYQWRRDGEEIAGANEATLRLEAVSFDDQDLYDVVIANFDHVVTSAPAWVRVDGAPLLNLSWEPEGTLRLGVKAAAGRRVRLQGSTDLRTWLDVQSFPAAVVPIDGSISIRPDAPGRLYRLVSP